MFRLAFSLVFASLLGTFSAMAGPLLPIKLEPMDHADAALVVVDPDGRESRYAPADLEQLPTFSLVTTTPWRDEAAEFQGVLLRDLLAANGLSEALSVVVVAENDYRTVIEREIWESVDILVATRVDGKPHSRRARGPIQFVIDRDAFEASSLTSESNLVWMAARIEAAN